MSFKRLFSKHSIRIATAIMTSMAAYTVQAAEVQSDAQATYVIATTQTIVNNSTELANLVDSKEAAGFNVQVITPTVWGGGRMQQSADNLRKWLQANYETENIQYLLLVGDPNPESYSSLPMKVTYPDKDYLQGYIPTDFYYADLNGNWDLNGNGKYGEFSGDFNSETGADNTPEISVGRIPVYGSDYATLDAIIAKSINYANATDTEWRNNVLLAMSPTGHNIPGYRLGEMVNDSLLKPNNISSFRIYEDESYAVQPGNPHSKIVRPDFYPTTVPNVVGKWSNDQFGYALFCTHGTSTEARDIIDSESAGFLNDLYPSFTFQISCTTGKPEDENNLGYSILKNGGVGTLAPTRIQNAINHLKDYNSNTTIKGMSYDFTKNFVVERLTVGKAWGLTASNKTPIIGKIWMNTLSLALYGDPSLSLDSGTSTPVWDASAVYTAGDEVMYEGSTWVAKWWTKGNAPSDVDWGAWSRK